MLNIFCNKNNKTNIYDDHCKSYENTNDLQLEVIDNGYIIPKTPSDKKIISNGAYTTAFYGGVTDINFNFIELSQIEDGRFQNAKGCLIGASEKQKKENVDYINETVIYIGDFRCHPAHFYLEALSRLWILIENAQYTNYKIAYIGEQYNQNCDFFDFFLTALGIDTKNTIHINKVTKFKSIIVPEASFKLNLSYNKAYLNIIQKIKQYVPKESHSKVYFAKLSDRSIGEDLAVEIFKNNGYEVFLPENLTMMEKITILANCNNFVASNGSNAHFSVFLPDNSNLTVLNRSDDVHYVQTQIDNLKNLNVTYVDCHCNLLPTWLSIGPFMFGYTQELENWLNSQGFSYNKDKLIKATHKNSITFIQNWVNIYSEPKKLALLENPIKTCFIKPSDIIKFIQILINIDIRGKNMKKQFYKKKKQLNIFGLKIKYKVKDPFVGFFQGILCLNQKYADKKIAKFKLKKKPIIKNMVLSMTSYPERMKDVHYAIFSILNQTIRPERFILWLAQEEFPNGEKDIPQNVLQFKKFGLEIKFTDAIRSFKKIVPALREFPDSILVSADDDIFYPETWLESMYKSYQKDPTKIYAHRLHRAKLENETFATRNNWEFCIVDYNGMVLNYPTSVGGVLYPPKSLHSDATNLKIFKKLCPHQDDLWVWAMALLQNTSFVSPKNPMNNNLVYINPERKLGISGETTLMQINGGENGLNDAQTEALATHYKLLDILNERLNKCNYKKK